MVRLRVTGMADQDAFAAVAAITRYLDVHLGHRAMASNTLRLTGRFGTRPGHAMGTEADDVVRTWSALRQVAPRARRSSTTNLLWTTSWHHNQRPEGFKARLTISVMIHASTEAVGWQF